MPAPLAKVDSSPQLPTSADVVVIGGGIIGSFAAYYLRRRGLQVALVEKGLIGAEQSSRNWGWCRQQNRDARELPLATKSLELWERFTADTGEQTGFRRCGLFYLSNDESELARWARWRDVARSAGVTTHMLSAAEASERGRATGRSWRGGVYSPTDGTADPALAAPAVARALLKVGGTVHQQCAARGLETSAGRVSGVVTERGSISTRSVILAAGAWASSFCRQLGIRFPQATLRQSLLAVTSNGVGVPDALYSAGVSITRRGDRRYVFALSGRGRIDPTPQLLRFSGSFLPMFARRWRNLALGGLEGLRSGHEGLSRWPLDRPTPMERMRILDPSPDQALLRLAHRRAVNLIPALQDCVITGAWGGYVDTTPDGVPAIGECGIPGFVLAAGFSGHGFGIGPGAGHLVADIVSGDAPIMDPHSVHPDRLVKSAWGKVADF